MINDRNSVWHRFAKDKTKSEDKVETEAKDTKARDVEEIDEPLNMNGKDLLELLKDALPPEITDALSKLTEGDDLSSGKVVVIKRVHESPFDAVSDNDFAPDPIVNMFKNKGGCGVVRAALSEGTSISLGWLNDLRHELVQVREATQSTALRSVFACIHSAKTKREAAHQIHAVKILDWLIKDADTEANAQNLREARKLVLAGEESSFDAAGFRVRSVFAQKVPASNMVRTAYTSLSTQDGEGYQMCPKAQFQIGRALPMELSKCRDNCIDSRTTREGSVSCAYVDWVKVADNMSASLARLDKVDHNLNDDTRMNIKEGGRGGLVEPASTEGMLNKDRKGHTTEQSLEAALDSKEAKGLRHKNEKGEVRLQDQKNKSKDLDHVADRIKKDHTSDEDNDEILDQLLEDSRNTMKDEDIDACAEELISKLHKNKA